MSRIKGKPVRDALVLIREPFYIGKRGIEITIRNAHGGKKLGTCIVNVGGISWIKEHDQKRTYKLSWRKIENRQ